MSSVTNVNFDILNLSNSHILLLFHNYVHIMSHKDSIIYCTGSNEIRITSTALK